MCGICGLLFSDPGRRVELGVLAAMNQTIRHRGPDSGGTHVDGPLGLAMRRLAIIDLQTGEQPLANEDGSVWIVFNGEIYNHAALRADLVKRGHVFKTASDTEAIVHLYEEHGIECVRQLRGMFAFAIWDARRGRLFLARDRLGKKPLYYAEHDGALIFGSELKCLLAYPGFPRDADVAALHHYLTLQYTPAPQSAFRAARQLPPAHRLVWEEGRATIDRYWELPFEPKRRATPELREEVRAKIEETVRLRLIGDVPLGAHLSGGVDSSVVVGLMAQAGSQPVRTFSIGFRAKSSNDPYGRGRRKTKELTH